jgi:hypothetical protein
MKRIRILLAAVIIGAGALIAAPSTSTALTSQLTITCHNAPATCVGYGHTGPLYGGVQMVAPWGGTDAIVCLDATCSTGAVLIIHRSFFAAAAQVAPLLGSQIVLTAHSAYVVAGTNHIALVLSGAGGVISGLLILVPGHPVCLGLDHQKLVTNVC